MAEPTVLDRQPREPTAAPVAGTGASHRPRTAQAWRIAQFALALSAGVAGLALWAHRGEGSTPAARAVAYRQALYASIDWNIEQMHSALDAAGGYDRPRFSAAALRVAELAPMLADGFPAGSDRPAKSAAKSEVWSRREDFHRQQTEFQAASSSLTALAAHGSPAAIRPAFAELTQRCQHCHATYLRGS